MLDPKQVCDLVVRPTLAHLAQYDERMDAEWAVRLLMGTAAVESGLRYLRQLGDGPALGLWQMEPATAADIEAHFVYDRFALGACLATISGEEGRHVDGPASELAGNLFYACAMARIHYWRASFTIPDPEDITTMARIWKRCYNTPLGAGTPAKFVQAYTKHIAPIFR